jgi:DNA mismatch repair protein MutS2
LAAEGLLGTLETMAELDLVHARARLSVDYRMTAPHFNQEGRLVLRAARHPLLEALFQGDPAIGTAAVATSTPATPTDREPKSVVPIDVNLGVRFHVLVVTGPNTGGKTVALKTVGLLAMMAQAGLHVPTGEGPEFPVFDDILADIGDEQSLEQSLSTFSSHVRRISEILGKATSRSLVLLDEMGAGTDPR